MERNTFTQKTLLLCDRGFEGYNLIAHCLEKQNLDFLIRVKQNKSAMREVAKLPMMELDCTIGFTIHLCWGVETAFRDWKYTLGLVNLHGKSDAFAEQEIYASLTAFNFASRVCREVVIRQPRNSYDRYCEYRANKLRYEFMTSAPLVIVGFAFAVQILKWFLALLGIYIAGVFCYCFVKETLRNRKANR